MLPGISSGGGMSNSSSAAVGDTTLGDVGGRGASVVYGTTAQPQQLSIQTLAIIAAALGVVWIIARR